VLHFWKLFHANRRIKKKKRTWHELCIFCITLIWNFTPSSTRSCSMRSYRQTWHN
jgi:hypothetical protein